MNIDKSKHIVTVPYEEYRFLYNERLCQEDIQAVLRLTIQYLYGNARVNDPNGLGGYYRDHGFEVEYFTIANAGIDGELATVKSIKRINKSRENELL